MASQQTQRESRGADTTASATSTASESVRTTVDADWVVAVATVINELNGTYEEEDTLHVCALYLDDAEQTDLLRHVELANRLFPFPSFRRGSIGRAPSDTTPTCRDILRVIESSVECFKADLALEDLDACERIDVISRALAIRSGLCRIAAELMAFLCTQSEDERAAREREPLPRHSHRELIADMLRQR